MLLWFINKARSVHALIHILNYIIPYLDYKNDLHEFAYDRVGRDIYPQDSGMDLAAN